MTELQHLQKVLLMITKDIDAICENNGINYYLLGGSAIGALRHHGFIPWDDDLDIVMDCDNYDRFIQVCRSQLNREKYYFQEAYKDWPMPFSKIRLKGTVIKEPGGYVGRDGEEGIYIDVFKLENAPSSKLGQLWQYFCAKYFLCYCLLERGWDKTTLIKRFMMYGAYPLKIQILRKLFKHQVEKYNLIGTEYCMFFAGRYRLKTSFYKKAILGTPVKIPFEDTALPVPEKCDEWLTQIFGDYMTPPPIEKQIGLHMLKVDFGKY